MGRHHPQKRRNGGRWQRSEAPANAQVQVSQPCSVPSKASSDELWPKCSCSHRGRKGKRGKESPTEKLHVTHCLCFTFLTGSFIVMTQLQGTWS